MTAVTPPTLGQAADDTAALAAFAERHDFNVPDAMVAWRGLPGNERAKWRAIADAAVEAARLKQPEELREAMTETRTVKGVVNEMFRLFRPVSGGWAARTSIGRLRRLAESAGVTPPAHATAQGDVPDEAGELRDLAAEMIAQIVSGGSDEDFEDGYSSSWISKEQVAKWRERAGIGG